MKALFGLLVVGVFCVLLSGCAGFVTAPVVPPLGWVYTDTKAPIDIDANNTPMTEKKGTALSQNILGLVAWGDASVKTAAADGKITTVEHIDYEMWNILGVYSKFTTVVYGK